MLTKIKKWGNSLAIRIPKSFAVDASLEEESSVNISMDGNKIIIEPVIKYNLKELLSQVNEENIHDEYFTGTPEGKEIW
ncbi:MAG: AbrB/MazE/SpoVT family DNA-binding domain-containing protein [Halanaerobiales bacterium]